LAEFLGAVTTFWLQRRNPEELKLASEALSAAEAERSKAAQERAEVLEYQADVVDALDELEQRDERRGMTATALLYILETVDQIVAMGGRKDIGKDVGLVLKAGADTLLKGLGLGEDRLCFSVFQRVGDGDAARMTIVGERRAASLRRQTADKGRLFRRLRDSFWAGWCDFGFWEMGERCCVLRRG
jgi:hypothetical protein